jgi:PAS domain S-box-containing protein
MEPASRSESDLTGSARGAGEVDGGDSPARRNGTTGYALFGLDERGCIANWSIGAQRLTGYTADEVIGQSYAMFGSERHATEVVSMLEQALQAGSVEQERWWRRRDAGLVWVHEVVSPVEESGGYVVVARDMTEQVDAAERLAGLVRAREEAGLGRESALRSELQAAERRAAFLAEASSILVATSLDFDSTLKALVRLAVSRIADWCVVHAMEEDGTLRPAGAAHRDPALETGLTEALDATLEGAWAQTIRSVIGTGQAHVLDGRPDEGWFVGGAPADSLRHVAAGSVMVTPLMGRGRVLGAITFVSARDGHEYDEDDVSLAEELGRRAAIALDNARLYREAQEANRAKADFLAVISHELRTPLNAIMGYSDLLDAEISGELTQKQRRQIERIRASARHLLQLIEEILSFARMEAGGEEVRPELVDAEQLVEEAAAAMEPLAEAKGLEFRIENAQPGLVLETDHGKARQVLVNLLSNAVKFTERGSVTLGVRQEGERAVFDIIDTGIGIPAEQIGRIFDPFWQVERPNTRKFGGTGLGLSVSRRYVRLLRGELAVDSEPGRGTRFSVLLPLRLTGTRRPPA